MFPLLITSWDCPELTQGQAPSPAAAFSTKCSSCQKLARSGYFSFTVKAMKCSNVIFLSVDLVSSSWEMGARSNAKGLNILAPQLPSLRLPGPMLPPPSYQIQALELEAIHSAPLAAVHVVPQCKYDLSKDEWEVVTPSPEGSFLGYIAPGPHQHPHIQPLPTSNICFSFCEDLTEAEAAMMALSCWKAR